MMKKATVPSSSLDIDNDDLLSSLRKKTRDVEELGVRIDELTRVNQDTQRILGGLGRYDKGLFDEMQSKSTADQKSLMQKYAQELDKFPRKNRNS